MSECVLKTLVCWGLRVGPSESAVAVVNGLRFDFHSVVSVSLSPEEKSEGTTTRVLRNLTFA